MLLHLLHCPFLPANSRCSLFALLALIAAHGVAFAEETIVFPDDAGVIDVTKPPYNARPDGRTDCTDAIQKALDDYAGKNRIIYLPAGTYLVSHQLEWGPSERLSPRADGKPHDGSWGGVRRLQILQGENRDSTIIRLRDRVPEFQQAKPGKPDGHPNGLAVVNTGGYPAQRFRNSIRNLTVNTGSGNPAAIGIQFNASNQGTLHRVRIVSGDGQGLIGLDIGYCGDQGPGAGRYLTIEGFDYGIWASAFNSMTLWEIDLSGQRKAGVHSHSEVLSLGQLRSRNTVPTLEVGPSNSSFVTLIEGKLEGTGAGPAISIVGKPSDMHLYCRDVAIQGYGKTVAVKGDPSLDVASGNLTDWSLHGFESLFPSGPAASLRLPAKMAPEVPMDPPGKAWANPIAFGALGDGKSDDTDGIQKAIDSGASTVYFPGGKVFNFKEITIRPTLRRMIGCETYLNGDVINISDMGEPIVFERFLPSWGKKGRKPKLMIKEPRTVIVRDLTGFEIFQQSAGEIFIEDFCGELFMEKAGAKTWARYFNYEPQKVLGIVNNGGDLWILGSKIEHEGPKVELRNNSRTELLGGFWYASFGKQVADPAILIQNSRLFLSTQRQMSFNKGAWPEWVKAIRGGETKIWSNRTIDALSVNTTGNQNP